MNTLKKLKYSLSIFPQMIKNTTIAAVATPPGVGALAIIRVSGLNAFKIVSKIIVEKSKFDTAKYRSIKQYFIFDPKTGVKIDEVTGIKYLAPKTYTGENLVEIISHGGFYTVKNIMNQLLLNGAEMAGKGEFSKRAFLNGKIGLLKAEAIKALIESKSENEYFGAINSYVGINSKIAEWKIKIQREITYCEAEIEFGEDESIADRSTETILEIKKTIQNELSRIKVFKEFKHGFNVIIAGPANTGKSTLFNYFLGYKRAIVHNQAGTTRDSIDAKIVLNGHEINLFDTAGIRTTSDPIEKEGILFSKELLATAHLVLWITDISQDLETEELNVIKTLDKQKTLIVFNKNDKGRNNNKCLHFVNWFSNNIEISLKTTSNLKKMVSLITEKISTLQNEIKAPDNFINIRQEKIARKIRSCLIKAISSWKQKEIVAYYLRDSLKSIEEIYGKTDNEQIINEIFNSFCIGK